MPLISLTVGLALAASTGERATALATRMVEALGPRPAATPEGDAAQDWVLAAIEERGWPAQRAVFGAWSTVWTCRRGQTPRVVLFLAHTDSVHSTVPGANDNAAAVAVLLTAMEDRLPDAPRRTVCFAFPDAEEVGLLGAESFAIRAVDQGMLGGPLDQVMSLELVGAGDLVHNGLGPAWGGARMRELLRVAPAEVPWLYRGVSWALPAMERSDHRPFADRGIPASMLLGRPDAGVFWAYHTPEDRPERLEPATLGAAVKTVRHVARARALTADDRPGPAAVLWGRVIPGAALWLAQAASGVVGVLCLRGLDRSVFAGVGQLLVGAVAFGVAVGVAGAGRPLHAALVEPVWAAGGLAALLAWAAWPWAASPGAGRALAGGFALLALGASPWLGSVLAAPLAVASLAAMAAVASPPWLRAALLLLAAWPALHVVRPAALRELAFHGLVPAQPAVWAVMVALLAVPVVAAVQGRGLPRRRGPWLGGLALALALAVAWAWSSPVHDDAFPPREQKWAGRP